MELNIIIYILLSAIAVSTFAYGVYYWWKDIQEK